MLRPGVALPRPAPGRPSEPPLGRSAAPGSGSGPRDRAGLVVLAVAICSALLLVVDVLFSRTQAWLTTGAVAALLLWWWVLVPLWQRSRNVQDDDTAD